nr:hypothetical protein Q903MT_gene868 [Picea sitchensis]
MPVRFIQDCFNSFLDRTGSIYPMLCRPPASSKLNDLTNDVNLAVSNLEISFMLSQSSTHKGPPI